MRVLQNVSLENYNTFRVSANAPQLVEVHSEKELKAVLTDEHLPVKKLILGGGSNILLAGDVAGMVLVIKSRGIAVLKEDPDYVWIKAAAGENWHDLVCWCLDRGYGGIENLSLIPGKVGAAPIQNIGAYGVELKDVFESCEALSIKNGVNQIFNISDCQFGYRDSYFKNGGKGNYVITSVNLKLTKRHHFLRIGYGAIQDKLNEMGTHEPGIKEVSQAVIAIRKEKLPDPSVLPNAGSFFKNPEVSKETFENLAVRFPDVPSYPASADKVKIPAGWLIEKCGYKGKRYGDVGVHSKQALVLVNYGKASGEEILVLSKRIQETVHRFFGILLETEVNIIS